MWVREDGGTWILGTEWNQKKEELEENYKHKDAKDTHTREEQEAKDVVGKEKSGRMKSFRKRLAEISEFFPSRKECELNGI